MIHTQTPYRYIHIVGIIGRLCVDNQGSECCASVKFEMLQSTALEQSQMSMKLVRVD